MRTRERSIAQNAGMKAARERRLAQVRPGWWVFSYGPTDLGSLGEVTATTTFTDPATNRAMVRLAIADPDGRRVEIENVGGYPTWCVTSAEARRVGLT